MNDIVHFDRHEYKRIGNTVFSNRQISHLDVTETFKTTTFLVRSNTDDTLDINVPHRTFYSPYRYK